MTPQNLRELDLILAGNSTDPESVSYRDAMDVSTLFALSYHHAIPLPLDRIRALWRRCVDSGEPNERMEKVERHLGPLQ